MKASTSPGALPTLPHKQITLLDMHGELLPLSARLVEQPHLADGTVYLTYTSKMYERVVLPSLQRGPQVTRSFLCHCMTEYLIFIIMII